MLSVRCNVYGEKIKTATSSRRFQAKGETCLTFRAQLFEGRLALNPGLNFNPGFSFFCLKAFSRIIFSVIFRAFNHQLVDKKIKTEILFIKLSNLNSNLALTLGYLNPALNNSAQTGKDTNIMRKIYQSSRFHDNNAFWK